MKTEPATFRPTLLKAKEAARALGMSRSAFFARLPRLRAAGLRFILIPSIHPQKKPMKRYVAASIDRLVAKALKQEKDRGTLIC